MKRFFASALLLGAVSGFGLVGCADESKMEKKETVTTPSGSAEKTTVETLKTTGDASSATGNTPASAK